MNRASYAWILSAAVLLLAMGKSHAVDDDAYSKPVSFQYLNSLGDLPDTSPITSPVVSYQYFDWPGDENVTFQFSPPVSYRYSGPLQIVTQPSSKILRVGTSTTLRVVADGTPPLSYHWRFNGQPLPDTAGTTIALDNLQSSDSGNYSVVVSNASGSMTSREARLIVYTPPPGTKPAPPPVSITNQELSLAMRTKSGVPVSTQLRWFNPGTGQFVDVPHPFPASGKKVIVLTHGWRSGVNYWPETMARALAARYKDKANIFAWNWETEAAANGILEQVAPAAVAMRIVPQGMALGQALMEALGPAFDRNIHFIGHSFGAGVNCAAANYLHGESGKRPLGDTRPVSEKYVAFRTHLTLLDEAAVGDSAKALRFLVDAMRSRSFDDAYAEDARQLWQDFRIEVIPKQRGWIDNYISSVGSIHPEAVNVLLWRNHGTGVINPAGWHGYAVDWYQHTVEYPDDSFLGHTWSFERETLFGTGCPMPPSYFGQTTSEYSLTQLNSLTAGIADYGRAVAYPTLQAARGIDLAGKFTAKVEMATGKVIYEKGSEIYTKVGATYLDGIQYAGDMLANFAEKLVGSKGEPVVLGTADSTAAYFLPPGQTPLTQLQEGWDLNFSIKAGSPQPQNLRMPMRANAIQSIGDGPVYTIIPVHVPNEAVGVSFEYMMEGAATEDFMTMGVGEEKILSMEAKYLEDGQWNGAPEISISNFRDRDVQLVFALNGTNGPPAGKLSIRNIEFNVPPRPQLEIEKTADSLTVSWPLSAIDWTIETTTDLSDPNGWQPESDPPTDADFFHTMTFDVSGRNRAFFRLKK